MNEVSTPTKGILEAWFSQSPTAALMGEFSAGKSTLLNLLLGNDLLTTQVTATKLPVIWMTYSDAMNASVLFKDGVLEPFDMKDLHQLGDKDPLLLRLSFPADILKRVDLIDTPGISDPKLALGALDFLKPYLDFVIWCSAANQAWRQSEKAMWSAMPEALWSTSILALTRSDTLHKAGDLKKVIKRCKSEAGIYFDQVMPIATTTALACRDSGGDVVDQAGWTASHAPDFLGAIETAIKTASQACKTRDSLTVPEVTKITMPVSQLDNVESPVEVESTTGPLATEQAEIAANPDPPDVPDKPKKVPGRKPRTRKTRRLRSSARDGAVASKLIEPDPAGFLDAEAPKKVAKKTSKTLKAQTPDASVPAAEAKHPAHTFTNSNIALFEHAVAAIKALRAKDNAEIADEEFAAQINHTFTSLLGDAGLSDDHRAVLRQAMSLDGSDTASKNAIILQLVREIEDFTHSSWHALDQIH